MNLGVTVVTGASHDLIAVWTSGRSMTKAVALRAQPRPRNLQHELVDRAVSFMTVEAVHTNRRVFEQEGSALLGMTLVASVIDGRCPQQTFIRRAVRIMAVGADHLAFTYRHVRRARHL